MKLSIIDRTIIYYSMLPEIGTIENLKLMRGIKSKIVLTAEEENMIEMNKDYSNMVSINVIDILALERDIDIPFTIEEIAFLNNMANNLNTAGRVTEYSLDTIELFLNIEIE